MKNFRFLSLFLSLYSPLIINSAKSRSLYPTYNNPIIAKSNSSEETDVIYKVWCGEIKSKEKASQRPYCNVLFRDQSLIINDDLEIKRNQLIGVKLNHLCIKSFGWNTCQPRHQGRLADKIYTITYKSTSGTNLFAVITVRDHDHISGSKKKVNINFRKDLEKWMGAGINDRGPDIWHRH